MGIAASLGVLWQFGATAPTAVLAVLVPGSILYFARARRRTRRKGARSEMEGLQSLFPLGENAVEGPEQADVIVALFGGERSPEMVAEVGIALAEGGPVLATHLRKRRSNPTANEASRRVDSLTRRLVATGERYLTPLTISAIASHDLVRTIHALTRRLDNRWLVVEEAAGASHILSRVSRLGWSIHQLGANLAVFRDRGVRYAKRILVVPRPGPHDALAVTAAADLGVAWNAEVTLMAVVAPDAPDAEAATRRAYLEELRRLAPEQTRVEVLRGDDVQCVSEESIGHDLVVLGAPELSLRALLRGSLEERIADRVSCNVLTVRTPRGLIHETVDRHEEPPPRAVDFVTREVVQARLPVETREDLFHEMSECFAAAIETRGGGIIDPRSIERAFEEREREQSTMVGDGVALPHASIDGLDRTLLGVFTVASPVLFEAGAAPVEVVFATIGPPSARFDHLRVLRAVAQLTCHPQALSAIVDAVDGDAIYDALELCSATVADAADGSYDARP